jgi:hypothetical protein
MGCSRVFIEKAHQSQSQRRKSKRVEVRKVVEVAMIRFPGFPAFPRLLDEVLSSCRNFHQFLTPPARVDSRNPMYKLSKAKQRQRKLNKEKTRIRTDILGASKDADRYTNVIKKNKKSQ